MSCRGGVEIKTRYETGPIEKTQKSVRPARWPAFLIQWLLDLLIKIIGIKIIFP
jgi:hypothetical protein